MTSDHFTALIGLLGVGIGAGGALIAAHMQASATKSTAEAAAEAALDGIRVQVEATQQAQFQAARRAAYASCLSAAHELAQLLTQESPDAAAARLARDKVEVACGLVNLEGPDEVIEAAWDVWNVAGDALHDYERTEPLRMVWQRLLSTEGGQNLVRSLQRVRRSLSMVEPRWRATTNRWAFRVLIGPGDEAILPDFPTHSAWRPHDGSVQPWNQEEVLAHGRAWTMATLGSPSAVGRPSTRIIEQIRSDIGAYRLAAALLVEDLSHVIDGGQERARVTADEANEIFVYAATSGAVTPMQNYHSISEDAAQKVLDLGAAARNILYPHGDES
ncbi:hypothetical protein [Streptomyces sp. B6B3]|uniref:hypothetical protein n=1 Tax=Streptomyces sp. B6B3 TaxID=3153570 RepID=UPI00325C7254